MPNMTEGVIRQALNQAVMSGTSSPEKPEEADD
jgi:hypothetical protein